MTGIYEITDRHGGNMDSHGIRSGGFMRILSNWHSTIC